MLEIKTIVAPTEEYFDTTVNALINEGWELVKRECFVTGSDRAITLYAELERFIDAVEEPTEEDEFEFVPNSAAWLLQRDPMRPYRCSKCGYKTTNADHRCPNCMSEMRLEFE